MFNLARYIILRKVLIIRLFTHLISIYIRIYAAVAFVDAFYCLFC